jgi:hypothetical protein
MDGGAGRWADRGRKLLSSPKGVNNYWPKSLKFGTNFDRETFPKF